MGSSDQRISGRDWDGLVVADSAILGLVPADETMVVTNKEVGLDVRSVVGGLMFAFGLSLPDAYRRPICGRAGAGVRAALVILPGALFATGPCMRQRDRLPH